MKAEDKIKIMRWALVALVVLNLTTILTVIYYRNTNFREESLQEGTAVQSESASMRFSGRYFRDQLNLNEEQMNRFREFNPQFRQQVRNVNYQLNDIRRKMLDEMSSPDCDSVRLNLLSDSVGLLHADLKRLTYKYYFDFKDICNNEQKVKLDQLFGEMFATDVQAGQYGPGGPNGRGRGRRFTD
jgi:Spy/CpxP family protein refolding chaperone